MYLSSIFVWYLQPPGLLYIIMNVCTHTLTVTAQDGETALILAAWSGSTDVVVELVRGGANLDQQNEVC